MATKADINEQMFGSLRALVRWPIERPTSAIVFLHGVGSNEVNLFELGPMIAEDRLVVSLRAPLTLGQKSFAWFHVQFTAQGPVHDWDEASESFKLIEEAVEDISVKAEVPLERIAIFGFSQGAIMSIGLALRSKLQLERYVASSGRTLPEFAELAKVSPLPEAKTRKVFLSHGVADSKLPIQLARNSEITLRSAGMNLTYKEYPGDHGIPAELIADVKEWIASS